MKPSLLVTTTATVALAALKLIAEEKGADHKWNAHDAATLSVALQNDADTANKVFVLYKGKAGEKSLVFNISSVGPVEVKTGEGTVSAIKTAIENTFYDARNGLEIAETVKENETAIQKSVKGILHQVALFISADVAEINNLNMEAKTKVAEEIARRVKESIKG